MPFQVPHSFNETLRQPFEHCTILATKPLDAEHIKLAVQNASAKTGDRVSPSNVLATDVSTPLQTVGALTATATSRYLVADPAKAYHEFAIVGFYKNRGTLVDSSPRVHVPDQTTVQVTEFGNQKLARNFAFILARCLKDQLKDGALFVMFHSARHGSRLTEFRGGEEVGEAGSVPIVDGPMKKIYGEVDAHRRVVDASLKAEEGRQLHYEAIDAVSEGLNALNQATKEIEAMDNNFLSDVNRFINAQKRLIAQRLELFGLSETAAPMSRPLEGEVGADPESRADGCPDFANAL